MTVPRRVWRIAPATLALVVAFAVIAGVSIPVLAYLTYAQVHTWPLPALLLTLTVVSLLYAWRFGLYPRIQAGDRGLVIVNPFKRATFEWDEITVLRPGENGLIVASPDQTAEAWCVQKSNFATKRGRVTRADRIAVELLELADLADPGPADEAEGIRVRRARHDEVRRLARMERAASEAEFGHIFPPEDYPYPIVEIARRWRRLLHDGRVRVRIIDVFEAPVGFVAFDAERIRHLGVVPHQTRNGYGSVLLDHACDEIFGRGAREAVLWVLVDNTRAREFYRARGWSESAERRDCEFPPYPLEMRMTRKNPAAPRRSR
jgi:ribosomal protein S18 acetylase RimI-like enzyme